MKIVKVYYSTNFKKSLNKFSALEKKKIKRKLIIFFTNPFNPQLKTHKLTGKLKKYWSFSVNYSLRILFEFINEESVGLIDIGTHEIYK